MADIDQATGASPSSSDFSVNTHKSIPGLLTVAVAGEVDLLTAPQFAAATDAAQSQTRAVLLDLSDVAFLGSAGLSVLVEASRRATDRSGRMAVLAPSRPALRAIEVTGLDAVLNVFEESDAAISFLTEQ